jgi:hypothetical protein
MRTPSTPGDATGAGRGVRGGVPSSPSQFLDALKRGFAARLLPLLADAQAAAEAELRRRMVAEQAPDSLGDQLTSLILLRRDASRYERRWHERIGDPFVDWPRRTDRAARLDAYALVSDDELQAQLIGQPVIEALERRFGDVLDIIDSRLWSLAASLGGESRPGNPFAPRSLIEGLLATFPIAECDAELRHALLRQYERLAGDRLGEIYTWVNTQLADAGYAMSGTSDYATLIAQPGGSAGEGVDRTALWSHDNALRPTESSWRKARAQGGDAPDAARGNLLRQRMRAMRERAAEQAQAGAATRREFSDKEFLSVLSLQQGNETPARAAAVTGATGPHLREALMQGAAGLGMSRDTSAPSPAQEDAIDLAGALFDGLRMHSTLSPEADVRLARLAWPYLRLALDDPYLFDEPDHPAMKVLSILVSLWDGNARAGEQDAELHALANEIADGVANDCHGNTVAFDRALATLESRLEPLRKRTEIAERRAWQSILGRERLQAARANADAQLAQRLQGRVLLASVAEFLNDQWRQSLVHAWLREGSGSDRYCDALAVGDAIIAVDEDAAHARGRAVAEGLLALEQPLRDCYVACGLDESGANTLLAALVSEIAQPDAKRTPPEFTPLAGEPAQAPQDTDAAPVLAPGQTVLRHAPGAAAQWLRVAWISPVSGRHLLVNRQGMREALMSADEIAAGIAGGELLPRSTLAPVEAVLQDLVDAGVDAK